MNPFFRFERLPDIERKEVIRLVDSGIYSDIVLAIRLCNSFGVWVEPRCESCVDNHILIKKLVNENR